MAKKIIDQDELDSILESKDPRLKLFFDGEEIIVRLNKRPQNTNIPQLNQDSEIVKKESKATKFNINDYLKTDKDFEDSDLYDMREAKDLSKHAGCITPEQGERLLKAAKEARDSWDR